MSRRIVPEPGTHTFQITATFEANAVAVAQGEILHDVVITESLPIGQTFVKGVSLQDGHLGLARDDIGIPGGAGATVLQDLFEQRRASE
jgi:hypothetical protein